MILISFVCHLTFNPTTRGWCDFIPFKKWSILSTLTFITTTNVYCLHICQKCSEFHRFVQFGFFGGKWQTNSMKTKLAKCLYTWFIHGLNTFLVKDVFRFIRHDKLSLCYRPVQVNLTSFIQGNRLWRDRPSCQCDDALQETGLLKLFSISDALGVFLLSLLQAEWRQFA